MAKTVRTQTGHERGRKYNPLAKRIVVYRFLALGLLLGLFDAWDWMPFRVAQRNVIARSLCMVGYAPQAFTHEGSPAVRVGDYVFFYTAECTYVDLFFTVVPFVWAFAASRRGNILRIALAAVIILGGNLIRTWASVYFNVRGTDWFYTHDLPDYIIWWPTVVVVALLALRRDFGDRFKPTPEPSVLETEVSMGVSEALAPGVEAR
jgi:exosortase/archaeosortase family protein